MFGHAFTVRGAVAYVEWGYHRAATVADWTLTRMEAGSGWTLAGTVRETDALRLAQRPLVFVAPHARGRWRWPIVDALEIRGASCTATLGPKERS
jgi:hypothetical protein